MRTAVDTNVIGYLWSPDASTNRAAQTSLDAARTRGSLVISGAVYAELCAAPGSGQARVDAFVAKTGMDVDWAITEVMWRSAADAFAAHAARRRSGGQLTPPRRLLADFIIGAHALHAADALLTGDTTFYRRDFPTLALIEH